MRITSNPNVDGNYTHQMEIRTEYLRTKNLKAVRVDVPNFKRSHKLIDQWANQAKNFSRLEARLVLGGFSLLANKS